MDKFLISNEEGKPRTYRIETVGEFLELSTWVYGNDNVAFRGQRRQRPLLPSVARDPEYVHKEKSVFLEFQRESLPYLNHVPETDWQWLAVAQHNGLPTRLLDWTKSSLAALWFAVERPPHEDQPGVVWAYGYTAENLISERQRKKSPFAISKTRIYFPDHVFPFIQAQAGLFTVHHRENDEFVAMEEIEDTDLTLTKIEIPAAAFQTIRYPLFRGGIHPSSIFPGLTGLVKRIRYQHELLCDEPGA